jgi:hypothetical protein
MTDIAPEPSDRPAHYRLSTETWEVILKEYREGATVPELALKWRVSQHALRRRITRHKATKRDWGDSQAITQAAMRADALANARAADPEARAARLFDGIEGVDEDDGDAASLARLAILASGRAMKGRLWIEAKALAGLAESYVRLGDRVTGHWANGGASPQEEAAMAVVLERLRRLDELEAAEEARRSDAAEHEQTFTMARGGLHRSDAGA